MVIHWMLGMSINFRILEWTLKKKLSFKIHKFITTDLNEILTSIYIRYICTGIYKKHFFGGGVKNFAIDDIYNFFFYTKTCIMIKI